MNIPFNKPHLTGRETEYIRQAVASGKISGDGMFTRKCQHFFESRYGFKKCFLTTSCTDALEMAAILSRVGEGDEVIVPSFTFVSSALAFVRQGARIVFADSGARHPNLNASVLERLITRRTRVIVVVHYAGVACDMDAILEVAERHHLIVVEDAAQAIDSFYYSKKRQRWLVLGSIGHFGCFSFYETKNIISGEGGMLSVNDESFVRRAEIIWEKGTNRSQFFRGEIDKYGWVDLGSSFLPSEIVAAFLWAQLENLDAIQRKRRSLWNQYTERFACCSKSVPFSLPTLPEYATNNAHMFYIVLPTLKARTHLIAFLKQRGIHAVFHYQSLHKSPFYAANHDGRRLPNCDRFANCLLRLPMFYDLTAGQVRFITDAVLKGIASFHNRRKTK